jgi:hypothetical protein
VPEWLPPTHPERPEGVPQPPPPQPPSARARLGAWAGEHPFLAILLGLVAFAVIVGAASGSHSSSGPAAMQTSFSLRCGAFGECSNQDAANSLGASSVACSWRGSDVIVSVTLSNDFNAKVKASVIPRYEIDNGGTHGNSFGSDSSIVIAPNDSAKWTANAGHPKGVPDGTPISKCEPQLEDIELTN